MKIEKLSQDEAAAAISKIPEREAGKWVELVNKVVRTGQAVKVTGLTRGQCYNLKKVADKAGLVVRTTDKSSTVIIMRKT